MKKLIICVLTFLLISCSDARVMTLVEMPEGWTDETGQEFLDKLDIRKLQYAVSKKFPSASQQQLDMNIMPLVFSPSGAQSNSYKYEVRVKSHSNWDKSKQVEKFIADYLQNQLANHDSLNPMVFVKIPDGYDINNSQKLLGKLDMVSLKKELSTSLPGIEKSGMHMKILPVKRNEGELHFHVMVISEVNSNFEYQAEKIIAKHLRNELGAT